MTYAELTARLEKLERDNRRLKGLGFAALLLAAALGAIAATRPVPEKITAHEFEVVDGSGRVRAIVGTILGSPGVVFYDEEHLPRLQISDFDSAGPAIMFVPHQASRAKGGEVRADVLISDSPSGQPRIELRDAHGYRMDLGSTGTQTIAAGETQQTFATSIVMFGNDKEHHVIWKAP